VLLLVAVVVAAPGKKEEGRLVCERTMRKQKLSHCDGRISERQETKCRHYLENGRHSNAPAKERQRHWRTSGHSNQDEHRGESATVILSNCPSIVLISG